MIAGNPNGDIPRIAASAYLHPTAEIIGDVKIGENAFIGPSAIIRADEPGSSIAIGMNCNVQDGVIIHALSNSSVVIEDAVSLSHGCIVHGPCRIGTKSFIGFGSVVFDSVLGSNVFVKHLSCVEGVVVPAGKLVKSKVSLDNPKKVSDLMDADENARKFAEKVLKANIQLANGYKK